MHASLEILKNNIRDINIFYFIKGYYWINLRTLKLCLLLDHVKNELSILELYGL